MDETYALQYEGKAYYLSRSEEWPELPCPHCNRNAYDHFLARTSTLFYIGIITQPEDEREWNRAIHNIRTTDHDPGRSWQTCVASADPKVLVAWENACYDDGIE